ncbi:K-box region and MADS-box transcription factor family protein [Actinidia rufa]|uniref:K-box region and MADS-box transcription factor family protein n=1 Tax=Actinidia rufa TaxID=165716 RepID=A0A7J0E9S2_9ERIC|nr:K-box region and MADS-box transcription factor family protein [Actinidia rufa]
MLKTLERYQKCSYDTLEVNHSDKELEQSSYREYSKLKGKYETLQCYQRQLLGEDLGPLNINELEHLEHQLETSLKQIRSTKLDDIYRENHLRSSWACGEQCSSYPQQNAQSQVFFQPLDCNSTLQIGYNPDVSNQMNAATHDQNMTGLIPGWML